MNSVKVRCLKCSCVYEKDTRIKGCPTCGHLESDPIMFFYNQMESKPIVPFEVLLPTYPKIMGLQVTSQN